MKQEIQVIGNIADVLIKEDLDAIISRMDKEDKEKFVNSLQTLQMISHRIIIEHQRRESMKLKKIDFTVN